MALREKFGRLVLLEETDSGPLGNEYRAARLGPSGFDRLVTVLRFSPAVSAHAEAGKRLLEEARQASQIHSSGIVRVLGVGRVGSSFYLSTELVEGRTARTVLARCRDDGFPFGADHALMIASRAAAALELLHARRGETGQPLVHGLVSPRQLVVAFDGEVKLKGLGLWAALGDTGLLAPEERAYLAPEQAEAGSPADPRADVYALGLVLLEALSGLETGASDPFERLERARLAGPSGERSPLPRVLGDLMRRALARDPAARFASVAELRRAVDTLLFSGDFTPTTFDLAFFMHTLFRAEVEREARALEEARAADYGEFLDDPGKGKAASAGAPEAVAADTEPPDTQPYPRTAAAAAAFAPTEPVAPTEPDPRRPGPGGSGVHGRHGAGPDSSQIRRRAAREAASRLSLGATGSPSRSGGRRSLWLAVGLVAAIGLGGAAGWLYFVSGRRLATPPVPSAEQAAAEARVRELEARIAMLEREKAEAEARAAEQAKVEVEQKAAAGGQRADPAAVAAAQEQARRRVRLEEERRQQQELQRLADEKRLEEQRLAAAAAALATPVPTPLPAVAAPAPTPTPIPPPPAAGETLVPVEGRGLGSNAAGEAAPGAPTVSGAPAVAPAATPAPTPPTTPPATPTPAPTPAPTVRPGSLVDVNDPTVTPPVLLSQPRQDYPDIAIAARAEGTVELRALVDETGAVADVTLVRSTRRGVRFEEYAERHVRGRKYKPATKGGVVVQTWLPIVVHFKLSR